MYRARGLRLQHIIEGDELEKLALELRLLRTAGNSMRRMARLMRLRHGYIVTPEEVWQIISAAAVTCGREFWQDRDPGKQMRARNPRRSTGWRDGRKLAMMERGQSPKRPWRPGKAPETDDE